MKYYKIIIDENANRRIIPLDSQFRNAIYLEKPFFSDIIHDDTLFEQEITNNYGFTISEKAKDVFVQFRYKSALNDFDEKGEFINIKFRKFGISTVIKEGQGIQETYSRIQFYSPKPTYVQAINFPKSVFKKRAKGTNEEHEVIFKDYVEYLYAKVEHEIKFEKLTIDKSLQEELGDLFYFEKNSLWLLP